MYEETLGWNASSAILQMTPNCGRWFDTLEVRAVNHKDLNKLKEWADRKLISFKDESQVPQLQQDNPMQQHMLWTDCVCSSSTQKELSWWTTT